MTVPNAARAGAFMLGDEVRIKRLGYGAMRVTGSGIWEPPADRAACLRALQRAPALGINFIDIAQRHHASASQIAISWSLKRSPVMLPIPGTSKCAHLEQNAGATEIELSDAEFASLEGLARSAH